MGRMTMTDDNKRGSEGTMARYTFEYLVPEAERWTRSRNSFSDRDTAAAEGERFLHMWFKRNGTNTLIRVVPVDE
jgi:hypothetical protein